MKKISQEQINEVAMLTANNASVSKIARETGLHHTSVKKILTEPATIMQIETYSQLMGEKMLELAASIVSTIDKGTILKAGLRDRVVACGILADKARQAYGLDKQVIDIRQITIRTDNTRLRELLNE